MTSTNDGRSPLRWLLAAALALGLTVSACGDDDADTTDPATETDSGTDDTEMEEMDDTEMEEMEDEGDMEEDS